MRGATELRCAVERLRPDHENNDGPDHRTDQACAFACPVSPHRLAKEGGDERAHDAQNSGQNEPRRLVRTWHEELGNHASNKPNDDGPDDTHSKLTLLIGKETSISGSGLRSCMGAELLLLLA
jgi:hypothetical protein